MAQEIINNSHNNFNSEIRMTQPTHWCGINGINIQTLKNLTIGQIKDHHKFICGADKIEDRSEKVTLAKRICSPINLSLIPQFDSSASASASNSTKIQSKTLARNSKNRDVKTAVSSADDILNSHQQKQNPISPEMANHRISSLKDVGTDGIKTADDIIISCDQIIDSEFADNDISFVLMKDKITEIGRQRVMEALE